MTDLCLLFSWGKDYVKEETANVNSILYGLFINRAYYSRYSRQNHHDNYLDISITYMYIIVIHIFLLGIMFILCIYLCIHMVLIIFDFIFIFLIFTKCTNSMIFPAKVVW